ncbi:cleavage and polyadenylation specificity factor subunit 6-like [Amphibalanus amphitrite]|uniref:cleavage and polyadenylation specificity factor subunit 6-like n=1 Tax=Amphibalanus amphitrite TaxID=1232801 RepID=UPI001C91E17D|nr:cleavage and polyadenylation specificity factor subunit 6-like [Amphibalanus amphitrite]
MKQTTILGKKVVSGGGSGDSAVRSSCGPDVTQQKWQRVITSYESATRPRWDCQRWPAHRQLPPAGGVPPANGVLPADGGPTTDGRSPAEGDPVAERGSPTDAGPPADGALPADRVPLADGVDTPARVSTLIRNDHIMSRSLVAGARADGVV